MSETGIACDTGERTLELIRGIRLHSEKLLKGLSEGDLAKAQLGLGHSYSRSKVKFNVNRSDNMIIQAIALVDQLDKDVNTFAMRVREWYGWHFPELVKLTPDNITYAKLARFIKAKENLREDQLDRLTDILAGDETIAKNILDASRASMGTQIGEVDMINIENFADRVINLGEYRLNMHKYLVEKMHLVAPNVSGCFLPHLSLTGSERGSSSFAGLGAHWRGDRCPTDLACWLFDQLGQIPGLDSADSWC